MDWRSIILNILLRFKLYVNRISILLNTNKTVVRSFLVGFLFRMACEIAIGKFPIGYDPSTSYILVCVRKDWLDLIAIGPLFFYLLLPVYIIVGNALVAVKIMACFVSGFFTMSLAIWGRKNGISDEIIISFTLFIYFYFVVLRIAWDLHRNLLGIALSLLALSYYKEKPWIGFIYAFLASFTHPLSIFIIGTSLLADLIKLRKEATITASGSVLATAIIYFYRMFIYELPPTEAFVTTQQPWYIDMKLLPIYFLWLYLPLLPFIFLLLWKRIRGEIKSLMNIIGEPCLYWILGLTIPSFIFIFAYRLFFLVSIPILYMVFNGFRTKGKKTIRLLIIYNVVVSATYPVISYIYPIHPSFRNTFPSVLIGGTMFPWDGYDAEALYREVKELLNATSALIVHHLEICYAYSAGIPLLNNNVITTLPADNFDEYLKTAKTNFSIVYIVWYIKPIIGSWSVPQNYTDIVDTRGNMAIYMYNFKCTN